MSTGSISISDEWVVYLTYPDMYNHMMMIICKITAYDDARFEHALW